jgi:hypothetical protein
MLPVGFEQAIPTSGLSQTYALDLAATGVGPLRLYCGLLTLRCDTALHATVSQYYALTVRIHISTPAAVYLVCLAKHGAATLKTQRTCWMQSDSLTAHTLKRLVHPFMALAPSGWLLCRPRPYVLKESWRQHVNDVARAAARNGTMADRVMCFSKNRHSVQHV